MILLKLAALVRLVRLAIISILLTFLVSLPVVLVLNYIAEQWDLVPIELVHVVLASPIIAVYILQALSNEEA